MNSGDRQEFDTQIAILCAGFNVPPGDRQEAYWKGMMRMSLMEFTRCVEYALGEDGPEKIPTCSQLWGLRKRMREQARATVLIEQKPPEASYTTAQRQVNLLLLDWLNWHCRNRGPEVPQQTARAMYAQARELADQAQMLLDERDPDMTGRRLLEDFCDRVLTIYEGSNAQRYRAAVLAQQSSPAQRFERLYGQPLSQHSPTPSHSLPPTQPELSL